MKMNVKMKSHPYKGDGIKIRKKKDYFFSKEVSSPNFSSLILKI